ncbi:MAG: ABC transporter ATP-binding protein [Tateyamaria sp.]|jgi:ABC-type uncharacterized transport system ATPase subunit|nr:ABC transporter ATP-binding protein [Tateyamaria sp.]MBT6267300.1 ABC transporter ATP-binding protein [Tateyamaria sp.]
MTSTLLELSNLTKVYPGVVANDAVCVSISFGEIHAILGENGAGKSTLVKMIYGLIKPDAGTMQMFGNEFAPSDPRTARAAGVAMVFQHFSLFNALTVAENIALGMENPPPMRTLTTRIREVSKSYGLPLSPDRIVGDLSAGEQQRVEIIRCLLQEPKLLIMDEPTSVLTPQEVKILFKTLRKISAEGTAILYISHKLEEIRSLCSAATILRRGKVVGTCVPKITSARDMAELMVGDKLAIPKGNTSPTGTVILSVTSLSVRSSSPFGMELKDITFEVRAGEVLGIGGVAGNGQDELLAVLSGELMCRSSMVNFKNVDVTKLGPEARRQIGILAAPEERLGHASVPGMSLTENAMLTGATREKLSNSGILNWHKTRAFAERIIKDFDVRTPGPENAARSLSGGNLQKFVIGREVLQKPEVLVVNQPTWGVDAAAAADIRQALLDLTASGSALVVISQDLDELMEISDNFAALNEGRLSTPVATQGLDVEKIGLMLGGAHSTEMANV